MKKSYPSVIFLSIFIFINFVNAQTIKTFEPFTGFQFGYSGQFKIVEKCNFIQIENNSQPPIPVNSIGGEIGFECSYHFNKNFGILLGLNLRTYGEHKFKIFQPLSTFSDDKDQYTKTPYMFLMEVSIPLQIEFHYPISNKIYFFSSLGVNLTPIIKEISGFNNFLLRQSYFSYPYNQNSTPVFTYNLTNDQYVTYEFLTNWGFYYKLPKNNLLKLSIGINLSSNNSFEGYYYDLFSNSKGAIELRNNNIAIQIGYIHTFNYSNAKKYIKYRSTSKISKKEIKKQALLLLK